MAEFEIQQCHFFFVAAWTRDLGTLQQLLYLVATPLNVDEKVPAYAPVALACRVLVHINTQQQATKSWTTGDRLPMVAGSG